MATLAHAREGSVSFLANSHYRKQLETTRATAVLVASTDAPSCPVAALIDPNPYLAYARIAELLHPPDAHLAGIHPSAVVSDTARIAASACIGPLAVIEADALIEERVFVGPGCIVQRGAKIGADSRLTARVSICANVRLGKRCIVHPGAVIGADGFGFAQSAAGWVKVPQVGSVVIGDDVEIGANTTIDRGAIDDTVLAAGVKLDNQIQVGHNVSIGAHTAIAGCVGISGSTSIGARCMIGGAAGIAGHLTIADDVVVTGLSMVSECLIPLRLSE